MAASVDFLRTSLTVVGVSCTTIRVTISEPSVSPVTVTLRPSGLCRPRGRRAAGRSSPHRLAVALLDDRLGVGLGGAGVDVDLVVADPGRLDVDALGGERVPVDAFLGPLQLAQRTRTTLILYLPRARRVRSRWTFATLRVT